MDKLQRLVLIKTSDHFMNCKCCGLTYMPMSIETETKCPKCENVGENDAEYLANESLEYEQVSNEYLYDNLPTYRELV